MLISGFSLLLHCSCQRNQTDFFKKQIGESWLLAFSCSCINNFRNWKRIEIFHFSKPFHMRKNVSVIYNTITQKVNCIPRFSAWIHTIIIRFLLELHLAASDLVSVFFGPLKLRFYPKHLTKACYKIYIIETLQWDEVKKNIYIKTKMTLIWITEESIPHLNKSWKAWMIVILFFLKVLQNGPRLFCSNVSTLCHLYRKTNM